MSRLITLLNGPNLNLLGVRQPEIYGYDTLSDVEARCRDLAKGFSLTLEAKQSNSEGQLVDWIQAARDTSAGIIINPGAYSHTSIALLDALSAFEGPVMEVHVSNIYKREEFRHHSFVSKRADGIVAGMGVEGYEMAMRRLGSVLNT